MESFEIKIESKRGTEIPCTVVLPDKGGKLPLVLMAHGFCATRHENGTFTMLAEKLAEPFKFVRVDFYETSKTEFFVGEMTFYSGGGTLPFEPLEWDYKLGEKISII